MRATTNFKTPSTAGFTLLEMLLAMAILSIALTALLGLANRALAVHDRLRQTTRATLLAQSRLAELGSASDSAPAGSFAPPDERFRWRLERTATPLAQVERLDLTVSWGAEERQEAVTLTSFARSGTTP